MVRIFCCSRLLGTSTTDRMPARAAAAATAFARLPVDGQASTEKPSSRAAASATATTRSLNECVGFPESSLTHSVFMPSSRARLSARIELGVAGVHVRGVGDARRHRQQRRAAPDVVGSGLDPPAQSLAGERELVGDLERTEALGTRVERAEFDAVSAFATGRARRRGRGRCRGVGAPSVARIRGWAGQKSWRGLSAHLPRGCGTDVAPAADRPRGRRMRRHESVIIDSGCRGFIGPCPSAPLDEWVFEVVRSS